ncbi:hypothetical protein C8F04DRAFT_1253702 [Mycena alexandri]|uniref:RING-type domain-containing protein n=1 Tax=Mycena alexandri TaxID=1745969 RepID=A0AAD6T6L2_9AGAR|nr:hypothetical protein C8F04DRAFT_1253702 [Mycena alexandri]
MSSKSSKKKRKKCDDSVFKGSSETNPWQLDDDGVLFLTKAGKTTHPTRLWYPQARSVATTRPVFGGPRSPSTSGCRLPRTTSIRGVRERLQGPRIIFGGPPSAIGRSSRPAGGAAPTLPRAATAPAAALLAALTGPAGHRGPTPRPPGLRLPRRHGYGGCKLTTEDLYIGSARPPVFVRRMLDQPLPPGVDPEEPADPKPHHKCAICCSIKSHPVSYACGHSHCFVCVRVWLEDYRTCPECMTVIRQEPFRHYGEENGIRADYPAWVDKSEVDISWAGMVFGV